MEDKTAMPRGGHMEPGGWTRHGPPQTSQHGDPIIGPTGHGTGQTWVTAPPCIVTDALSPLLAPETQMTQGGRLRS